MEFRKLLEKRRSIRKFREKKIPADLIERIISDATLAPNAGNQQPWTFIVITDKALIGKISDDSKTSILEDITNHPDSPLKVYQKPLQNPDFNVFYNTPCLVCITGRANVQTTAKDCTMAASYLMLSAANLGLGTCWVELGRYVRDPDLLKAIRLPMGHEIYAPVVVGYPEKIPVIPKRKRPEILKIDQPKEY